MHRVREFKADYFKAFGHPTRLGILEMLRAGELTVSELQTRLGIEATSVSQQLAVLRAKRIVASRKEGTNVYYRVRDGQVFTILDLAREIVTIHLHDFQTMAGEEGVLQPHAITGAMPD